MTPIQGEGLLVILEALEGASGGSSQQNEATRCEPKKRGIRSVKKKKHEPSAGVQIAQAPASHHLSCCDKGMWLQPRKPIAPATCLRKATSASDGFGRFRLGPRLGKAVALSAMARLEALTCSDGPFKSEKSVESKRVLGRLAELTCWQPSLEPTPKSPKVGMTLVEGVIKWRVTC